MTVLAKHMEQVKHGGRVGSVAESVAYGLSAVREYPYCSCPAYSSGAVTGSSRVTDDTMGDAGRVDYTADDVAVLLDLTGYPTVTEIALWLRNTRVEPVGEFLGMFRDALSEETLNGLVRAAGVEDTGWLRVLAQVSMFESVEDALLDSVWVPEVQKQHIRSCGVQARLAYGCDPATPPAVLSELAQDWVWEVRRTVARNPSAPSESLESLAHDEDLEVRVAVAENRNASRRALAVLAEDGMWAVRWPVARNPHTSSDTLTVLAGDDSCRIRELVVQHPHTRVPTLASLADDADPGVRWLVAANSRTPRDVLVRLADDRVRKVRVSAEYNLTAVSSSSVPSSRLGAVV